MKVFISYAKEDRSFVRELAAGLENAGCEPFWDERIGAGADWFGEIDAAISGADARIVVLSPTALASPWVKDEIERAVKRRIQDGRPLIPVVYRQCPIPELLSPYQAVDFTDGSPAARAASLERLLKGLHRQPSKLPAPGAPSRSLPQLLGISAVVLVGLLLIARALWAVWSRDEVLEGLRQAQRDVQAIDDRVGELLTPETRALFRGRRAYRDPRTREVIAADLWSGGRLQWRQFFSRGRLIARDRIEYEGRIPTQKVRWYFDRNQRLFLIDEFTQDGMLIVKKRYPGDDRLVDVMRSPLPPAGLMFYR